MSLKKSLRTIFACLVLEIGLLAGCPMRPEQIEQLMQMMNHPKLAHTLPDKRYEGDDPLEDAIDLVVKK